MLKRFKNFSEGYLVKNPHDLIVGEKYKITHPVYDDFDEGLEAEIDTVTIDKKTQDGFIVTDEKFNQQYELKFNYLMTCEVEKI